MHTYLHIYVGAADFSNGCCVESKVKELIELPNKI